MCIVIWFPLFTLKNDQTEINEIIISNQRLVTIADA